MVVFKETINQITVTAVLDKRYPKNGGLFPMRIRVAHKKVQKYYNTGKELSLPDWERLASTRNSDLVKIRNSIKSTFDNLCRSIEELVARDEFSFTQLEILRGRTEGQTLNAAIRHRMESLRKENRIGTMRYYGDCLASIEKFSAKEILYECVTEEWLRKFENFMLKRGMGYSSIGMRMRGIRTELNSARKKGYIKDCRYPFGKDKYEIPMAEGVKKALTLENIVRIVNYDDGNETTSRYRDMWFFIYLCNGINVADLVSLKFSDIVDGEIRFMRQKTIRTSKIKKTICVPLTSEMEAIIRKWGNKPLPGNYIFPLVHHYADPVRHDKEVADVIKRINNRTKFIGETLGIGRVTTYTARHSFATVLKRSGANIAYISESLGHNDLKTTESYLASFEKDERLKNAALLTNFAGQDAGKSARA